MGNSRPLYGSRIRTRRSTNVTLDATVASAYGWVDYSAATTDDEILARLLARNLERAGQR